MPVPGGQGSLYLCRVILCALLCATLGGLTYFNTLQCGIVYDDEPAIKKNQDLRPDTPWSNILIHDFWGAEMTSSTSHKSYRPLCVATFRLNYLFHGLEPWGYHLVNVVLHALTCFLFVCVCISVGGALWPGMLAGMLFAVHPIHTEAVAGLVGRTELLAAIFFLLSFLAYRKSILSSNGMGYGWLSLSLVFTVCSAVSKEQGITVVAVCVIYEFFIVNKMTLQSCIDLLVHRKAGYPLWFQRFFRRTVLLGVFTVLLLLLRLYLMKEQPTIFSVPVNPPLFMNSPYRQLNWLYLVFINTWQLLFPSFLCPDWRFDTVPLITTLLDPRNLLTLMTFASLATLGLYSVRRGSWSSRMTLFSLSLMAFPFIPASNLFFPVGFVVAERVLYLPSMGYCLLVGHSVSLLIRNRRNIFARGTVSAVVLALIGIMALKSIQRNTDWISNVTLYSSGVRCNSHNGVMLTNLGIEHGRLKNFTFAEKLYRRSMKVAPDHSRGFSNFGGLMEALKRFEEAEEAFKTAVLLGEKDSTGAKVVETYEFLVNSVILRKGKVTNRYQDALELWDQAQKAYPTYAQPYGWKGTVLYKMGRMKEAKNMLEIAVSSKVNEAEFYYYLGLCYLQEKRDKEAKDMFGTALRFNPKHSPAATEFSKI